MKNPKTLIKRVVLVLFLFVAAYGGGTIIGLIIQQAAPEPEQCALHDLAMVCHAPVLMNLATGEYVEMQVYEYALYSSRTAVIPRTGYMRISHCAGLTTFTNAGYDCTVDLPRVGEVMNNELFCRKCRFYLSAANGKGYALLDLHDPNDIRPHVVAGGMEYEINGYTITIEKGNLPFSLKVKVVGHLLDTAK